MAFSTWPCRIHYHQVALETRHTWEAGGEDGSGTGQASQVCRMSIRKTRTQSQIRVSQTKNKSVEGALKRNKLEPGELVFTDQYESRLPGGLFGNRGSRVTSQKYKGGTLFCDTAFGRVIIHSHVSITAEEKITSKLKFECKAMGAGVQVKDYNSVNGVYTSKAFIKELHTKGQGIKQGGVRGHHHHGFAKNYIKNVVRLAPTIMIHAALRWPEVSEKELWPMQCNMMFTYTIKLPRFPVAYVQKKYGPDPSQPTVLCRMLTLGDVLCTCWIPNQDGNKLPNWAPRSRRAQSLGASPIHASTAWLVRNPSDRQHESSVPLGV
jgi:hypothetical protein